jgi:methylaspartate mutase epsilon subunit
VRPGAEDVLAYARRLAKPTVAELLAAAAASGRTLIQPRCGVGGHEEMRQLLTGLERQSAPDILTITIDSHTRLLRLRHAEHALRSDPKQLNGYPLVTHGWRRGRELNESVRAPLQVRHGSPDPGVLFDASVAAGVTSFEGGGIGYNVPYAKDVPITTSLRAWRRVDQLAGEMTEAGVVVDREFFGSLTGVLVPPAIALAVTLIEAALAAAEGVRCLSVAYPQGGHPWQDLAALRAVRRLAARYLGPVPIYPVLHQFMGAFPAGEAGALCLIRYGGLIAGTGNAVKVVTKSPAEATGIPSLAANVAGIAATRAGLELAASWDGIDEAAVAEECEIIEQQVIELADPVLESARPAESVARAFADGRLDVPFAASRFARSAIVPCRDAGGAIRFADCGSLPFSAPVRRSNDARIRGAAGLSLDQRLARDISYFAGPCPLHLLVPGWPPCEPGGDGQASSPRAARRAAAR